MLGSTGESQTEEYGIELVSAMRWKMGEINLPLPDPLPNRTEDCPYVIVGDDAFALKPLLMKPYPQQDLDLERQICNYCFSQAQRIVENVFGLLAKCWQIFRAPISFQPKKVEIVAMATVTLHNWLIKGPSKDVYVPPCVIDTINPSTSEIVPDSGEMMVLPPKTCCLWQC